MNPPWTKLEAVASTVRAGVREARAPIGLLPPLSLRQLLTALVLVTAIPLLALALVMSSTVVATERQNYRNTLMSSARTLSSLVENEIDIHLAIAAALATAPALQRGDIATFKSQAIKAIAVVPGAWINLSNPSGELIMSTAVADGEPLPVRNTLDVMQKVWSSGEPQVSDVVIGQVTKRHNAILEVPVFNDGKPLYSILIGLSPDRFLAHLRGKYGPDAVVGLVDRKMNFVARIPDHDSRVGTPASAGWRASMARSPEGLSDNLTLEGEASVTPYVRNKYGWTVGIAYPKRVIEAPVRNVLWTLALLGGALTFASLAFGAGLARTLVGSMQSLVDAAENVGDGKIVAARVLAVKEATQISQALSATSETLATRVAEVKRASDTFSALVEHAPFGVYLVNSDFQIVQISDGSAKAFANVQPVLGRDLAAVLRAIWPEKFADDAISRFRHTLETGEPYHQSSLEETRRDTGVDEAYDWQIERVSLPNGAFGVVCYFYDLTAQKQAEKALRENDVFTNTVLEASPDCLKVGGLDGRLHYVNQNGVCLLQVDHSSALIGTPWQDLWPQSERPTVMHAIDEAKAGRTTRFIANARLPNGTQTSWDVTVAPVLNSSGVPVKFLASSRDITEIRASEAALRESEIRFRETFENAAVGVAHVGLDGRFLEVNQRLCDILGYTQEDLRTTTFQDLTHRDELKADHENRHRLMVDEIQSYGTDKRYIRKDGSEIWCGLTASLRRDANGIPLYFISIVRDITARKAAEAHREFLLHEIAHRMKNQLAVIQSMAVQTARHAGSVKQLQEQFSQRLKGLAVATDLLVSQGWTGAQLLELVERQLEPFAPAADRLNCQGPNVSISPDATQSIGLALHELATNAVKYGAWSAPGGIVAVSWQLLTNGSNESSLRLRWLEQGGPDVVTPTRKGFGNVVIESVAAQRVGGTAELVFAPEGLSWTLTIPKAHIVAAGKNLGIAAMSGFRP